MPLQLLFKTLFMMKALMHMLHINKHILSTKVLKLFSSLVIR